MVKFKCSYCSYVQFCAFCVIVLLDCCHRVSTKCVLDCCHRVSTQLQLTNISFISITHWTTRVVNIYDPTNSTVLCHYAHANSTYQRCKES
jgi:hypothetical protein